MNEAQKKTHSKFLSKILRHSPDAIGLRLDNQGWADVAELILKAGNRFTMAELEEIVDTNEKKRFAFNESKTRIRASQGHSIDIDLALPPAVPPAFLYHGTTGSAIKEIRQEGIKRMSRQHVHLSIDKETAIKVGSRHGVPVILTIRTGEMHADGFVFWCSENNVWLTDAVPKKYIDYPHNFR
ncbi:putative RNA 2'-phosphotransferase [Chitinophaga dinghuensis]|uniref:Probable RNA 2'-phosphotransferase n=1 Tax=Chitinophaga dinghuensis TaxID=1539050 RepID=A0A327VWC9_9BACT|nr:RNA 2'-phosphotransferase [Chitinophaga dinghuensis]RAJ79144.1 putative RNA 2'-phosphotransferase [Chitinophaga dinghuensis]